MSYIRYLCLFAYSGVQQILCCVVCFAIHRLDYLMLSASLNCPFLIASSVFSDVYIKENISLQYFS